MTTYAPPLGMIPVGAAPTDTVGNQNIQCSNTDELQLPSIRVFSWLRVKVNFGCHRGTALAGSSADFGAYLFGFEVRRQRRISPFAHVLLGVAHESTSKESIAIWIHNTLLSTNDTAFGVAWGGGLDIRVARLVSIRAIEVDYLRARFAPDPNPYLHPGGHLRLSAGLALHF